jgi:hypothetical protein
LAHTDVELADRFAERYVPARSRQDGQPRSSSLGGDMDPVTVEAAVVLGVVLVIFAGISLLGLVGTDSRRW